MSRPARYPALALAAALLAGACASTPDGSDAQALTGCWYFQQDSTARELALPWGVRLTADSLTGWPADPEGPLARRAITLRDADRTADFPFGYWQVGAADSVRIGYPGTGGFLLRLAVEDEAMALVGSARPVGDAGLGPRPAHDVRLIRARCPDDV